MYDFATNIVTEMSEKHSIQWLNSKSREISGVLVRNLCPVEISIHMLEESICQLTGVIFFHREVYVFAMQLMQNLIRLLPCLI